MSAEPKVSRGLRSLKFQASDDQSKAEYSALKTEAESIEKWWSEDRWKNTKRNYSALDVACLRNSACTRETSFSSTQSKKLYSLLTKLHKVGGYSHTFGSLDPVQVIQMAPHLTSIYVSGWQCSSTASTTNEPGPDFADYPMNTVPNKVDQLIRAQLHHDRRQHFERSSSLLKGQQLHSGTDFLTPIVADGDTGKPLEKRSPCLIQKQNFLLTVIFTCRSRRLVICNEANQTLCGSWRCRRSL